MTLGFPVDIHSMTGEGLPQVVRYRPVGMQDGPYVRNDPGDGHRLFLGCLVVS